ncbi:hypothetical protein KIPB_007576 [Kipferlia bialata]|uniref:Uncharacterized protein n=1 Tax=Kipferlia bialata TaxID=797122 RepID=A0A9K3CYS0_9EUKA|nr:hypothetical protein KIPB_007576 [Kipferlia bialata]|eukprot:g7576.t1
MLICQLYHRSREEALADSMLYHRTREEALADSAKKHALAASIHTCSTEGRRAKASLYLLRNEFAASRREGMPPKADDAQHPTRYLSLSLYTFLPP